MRNRTGRKTVETDMHELTRDCVTKLDMLFRRAARAWSDLSDSLDIDDYRAFHDCASALDALEISCEQICRVLTNISDGSKRERDLFLARVSSPEWPGMCEVLKNEASEYVSCPKVGWAISIEHGWPFWVDEDDAVQAAAKGLAEAIAEDERLRAQDAGVPEPTDAIEVSDDQALAWFMDRIVPKEDPFEWARRLTDD